MAQNKHPCSKGRNEAIARKENKAKLKATEKTLNLAVPCGLDGIAWTPAVLVSSTTAACSIHTSLLGGPTLCLQLSFVDIPQSSIFNNAT